MKQFKMLNNKVKDIVQKLAEKAPGAQDMTPEELKNLSEAIDNTISMIQDELKTVQSALSEVIKVTDGELARRNIDKKMINNISIFDTLPQLENK